MQRQKKELEVATKALNAEIEELDRALSGVVAESELGKFTRNGNTFYLSSRVYASTEEEQKDALFAALRQRGYGDLVTTENINSNTLTSFYKERMAENGVEVPEWISAVARVFEKVSVGICNKSKGGWSNERKRK